MFQRHPNLPEGEDDGKPAAGLLPRLKQFVWSGPETGRTDEQGVALVEGLPEAKLSVTGMSSKTGAWLQIQDPGELAIVKGRTTQAALALLKPPPPPTQPVATATVQTLSGRVTNLQGQPVVGVKITAVPKVVLTNVEAPCGEALTDVDGRYAITGLPADMVCVALTLPPGSTDAVCSERGCTPMFTPQCCSWVSLDQWKKPYDFVVGPALVAKVRLSSPAPEASFITRGVWVNWGGLSSNSSSPFEILNGRGELEVHIPQELCRPDGTTHALKQAELVLSQGQGPIPVPAKIALDLRKAEQNFDVQLIEGGTIGGVVQDSTAKAVPAAMVLAWKVQEKDAPGNPGPQSFRAVADDQGLYTLRGLPEGSYDLEAFTKDDRNLCTAAPLRLGVKAGAKVEAPPLPTTQGAMIEGQVYDSRGKPVAARLRIAAARAPGVLNLRDTLVAREPVVQEATAAQPYRILRLPPGKYTVQADLADPFTGMVLRPAAHAEEMIEVKAGERQVLDLEAEDPPASPLPKGR
jgi:hypothetical protein